MFADKLNKLIVLYYTLNFEKRRQRYTPKNRVPFRRSCFVTSFTMAGLKGKRSRQWLRAINSLSNTCDETKGRATRLCKKNQNAIFSNVGTITKEL